MSNQLPRSIQCGVPCLETDRHLKVVAVDGCDILPRLFTTVSPECNGARLKRLAKSPCSTCPVTPIGTLPRDGDHVPNLWRCSSHLPVCRAVPDCDIHLIRVSWTGHIRKWHLSSRDISSEWRKTVEERGGGDSRTEDFCAAYVAGAVFHETEVVDTMATLLCSLVCMDSKIGNGDFFGPEIFSLRKKITRRIFSNQSSECSAKQPTQIADFPLIQTPGFEVAKRNVVMVSVAVFERIETNSPHHFMSHRP